MGPVVHLRSAVCLLGRFPALAGVDLDVDAGEAVLVRGPNGAGKTSLLRALAGLLPVVDGRAEVLGTDLRRDRRSLRPRVGLLSHAAGTYDDLTVGENLRFWARAAGRPRRDVHDVAASLGLLGRLHDTPVGRLSAGQRRRLSIALVAVRRPEMWLLDEPHAGLDAAARDVLDGLVGAAVAAGATVVLASHDLDRAAPLAARQVVLAGGRVVEGGVPGAGVEPRPRTPALVDR